MNEEPLIQRKCSGCNEDIFIRKEHEQEFKGKPIFCEDCKK